jgi:hypothetical protein
MGKNWAIYILLIVLINGNNPQLQFPVLVTILCKAAMRLARSSMKYTAKERTIVALYLSIAGLGIIIII